ncbi:MAG: hypothetical protein IKF82_01095 [Bacilli bacterium]|nr:hypothetical protein [Bacilli bacterium]
MSYIYRLSENPNLDLLKEIGFELLPAELYGSKDNETIYYKIIQQPLDGQCVKELVGFYESIADNICTDQKARRAHCDMGIRFKFKDGHYHLVVTKTLLEMFSMWRIEIDLETKDVYFTISDGNMPSFSDAELVLDKYCKETIDMLLVNDLIYKEELVKKAD